MRSMGNYVMMETLISMTNAAMNVIQHIVGIVMYNNQMVWDKVEKIMMV